MTPRDPRLYVRKHSGKRGCNKQLGLQIRGVIRCGRNPIKVPIELFWLCAHLL